MGDCCKLKNKKTTIPPMATADGGNSWMACLTCAAVVGLDSPTTTPPMVSSREGTKVGSEVAAGVEEEERKKKRARCSARVL